MIQFFMSAYCVFIIYQYNQTIKYLNFKIFSTQKAVNKPIRRDLKRFVESMIVIP
jgi:hypothetical protein